MKPFLGKPRPKGWGKNAKNAHAKGRKTATRLRATRYDREREQVPPPPVHNGKRDYLFANCVVLAAAVFGPSSQRWAEDLLPMARRLDARRAA